MNALPTSPRELVDAKAMEQYFNDLDRLQFDIAYNSCAAIPHEDIFGSLATAYKDFASMARSKGYAACIQIPASICYGDHIPLTEAQFDVENNPERWGERGFFASFSSQQWKDYVRELTRLFIEDYGYNWVVFDEPLFKVDIPGTKDRFYRRFLRAYPGVEYPETHSETPEYLKVQRLKSELVYEFYKDLVIYAKSLGAEQVGAMLRPFVPCTENTPTQTLNTSCDNGRIAAIPQLDFTVARMQPDHIYKGLMRTGDDMQISPLLYYPEMLSHCVGKPFLTIINTDDPDSASAKQTPVLADFYRQATLASVATLPNGIMKYWNKPSHIKYEKDHLRIVAAARAILSRFGLQASPIAFIYSASSGQHAEPYTYESVWKFYWSIFRQTCFRDKWPVLTLSADALKELLDLNKQTVAVILEEHYPLTSEQVDVLLKWWKEEPNRVIIVLAGGNGFSADTDKPGLQPINESFPGLLQRLGLKQGETPSLVKEDTDHIVLQSVGVNLPLMGQREITVKTNSIANVSRVFGSKCAVLYSDENQNPVITKTVEGNASAYFCGISPSMATNAFLSDFILHATFGKGVLSLPVTSKSVGLVWNESQNGYVLISNSTDMHATAKLSWKTFAYWDVLEQKLIKDSPVNLELPPYSMRVFRCVPKRTQLYDITGATYVESITAGAGRANIRIITSTKTTFIVRCVPKETLVDSHVSTVDIDEACDGFYKISIQGITPGHHVVSMKW